MATRDIELIIRAKDTATSVVKTFTQALNTVVQANQKVGTSADKVDSQLTQLGKALQAVAQQVRANSPTGRLAQESAEAAAAIARLEGRVSELKAETAALAGQQSAAAAATQRFAAQQGEVAARLKQQETAIEGSEAAYKALSAGATKAAADQKRFAATQTELTGKLATQEAAVVKAAAKYGNLASQMAATSTPTRTLARDLERSVTALAKKEAALAETAAAYERNQQQLLESGQAVSRFAQSMKQAEAAIAAQKVALGTVTTEYAEISAHVAKAAAEQTRLDEAAKTTARELDKQTGSLEKSRVAMREMTEETRKSEAAMREFGSAVSSGLNQTLTQQRRAMLEARREWSQSEAAVKALAVQMRTMTAPSAEMAASFDRARAAAAAAKGEYLSQRAAYTGMAAAARETGTSLEGLAQRQERVAAIQRTAAQSTAAYRASLAELASAAQRAGSSTGATETGIRRVGTASRQAAGEVRTFSAALREFYGGSRQALSTLQRLRGQVLALIAAHAGFYGVFRILRQAVEAYQTLEAATSRLNVVFEGSDTRVGQELDFIRRQADRLGIEFGTLSDLYTQFAVAAKGTNLTMADTRKIFVSVAEAGRVNKLSLDNMRGVFLALQQMVSKGTVSMEELRRQLGDRLPGAVQIMADALGVSVAELFKMVEANEVANTSLIKFAEELDKRFGSQLAAALQTTTTEIGRFKNSLFQALVAFGEAGFIESFTNMLRDMNETLRSSQAESFMQNMSKAAGFLAEVLAGLVRNFDLVVIAASAFIGVRITPFVLFAVSGINNLRVQLAILSNNFTVATAAAGGFGVASARAATGVTVLRTAITGLFSSTGIGLLVTGAAIAFGTLITRTDEATAALNNHRKVMDDVKNAYDSAGVAAKNWADNLKEGTLSLLIRDMQDLEKIVDDSIEKLDSFSKYQVRFGAVGLETDQFRPLLDEVDRLVAALKSGEIGVEHFIDGLDDLAQTVTDEKAFNVLTDLIRKAKDETLKYTIDLRQAKDAIIAITGSAEESAAAWRRLTAATEQTPFAEMADQMDEVKAAQKALDTAMKRSTDIIKEATDSYDKAAGSVEDWRNNLTNLTRTQIEGEMKTLAEGIKSTNEEIAALLRGDGQPSPEQTKLAEFFEMFTEGRIGIDELKQSADAFVQSIDDPALSAMAKDMFDTLDASRGIRSTLAQMALLLETFGASASEVRGIMARIAQIDAFKKSKESLDDLERGFKRINENRLTRVVDPGDVKETASYLERWQEEIRKANKGMEDFGKSTEGADNLKSALSSVDEIVNEVLNSVSDVDTRFSDAFGGMENRAGLTGEAIKAAFNAEQVGGSADAMAERFSTAFSGMQNDANLTVEAIKASFARLSGGGGDGALEGGGGGDVFAPLTLSAQGAFAAITAGATELQAALLPVLEAVLAQITAVFTKMREESASATLTFKLNAQSAASAITSFANSAVADLNRIAAAAKAAAAAVAAIPPAGGKAGGGPALPFTPRRASGGPTYDGRPGGRVWGRGTTTSDSNIFALSSGEWVINANAVRHYGHRFMDAVNRRVAPFIETAHQFAMPRRQTFALARGGPAMPRPIGLATGGPSGSRNSVRQTGFTLNLAGKGFDVVTDESTFRRMQRRLNSLNIRQAGGPTMKDI